MNSLKHNNWKLFSTSHPKRSWSTLKSYQTNSIPSYSSQISPTFSFPSSLLQRQSELGPAFSEEKRNSEKAAELVAGEWNCPCRAAQGMHSSARFLLQALLTAAAERARESSIKAFTSISVIHQWHTSLWISTRCSCACSPAPGFIHKCSYSFYLISPVQCLLSAARAEMWLEVLLFWMCPVI